jgi:regulatory protein
MLVQSRAGRYSSRAIAHELRERGVARDAAEAALERLDGRDELAEASALWQRRFGEPPRDERDKARQVRFLLTRGYALGTALQVVKAAGMKEA